MLFTSFAYLVFLLAVVVLHWLLPGQRWRNALLLAANFVFYGFVHPGLCLLLLLLILLTYGLALAMAARPDRSRLLFWAGVAGLLGVLAAFKYFNFFYQDVQSLLRLLGLGLPPLALRVALPAGISFYTFLLLAYLIDVRRGTVAPCRSLVSFALFASFFPLLLSGPIERAKHLLPQIEGPRRWQGRRAVSALALLVRGYVKKMVVADSVAYLADRIFLLERVPLPLLLAGAAAFAVQVYADFSGYTDIARASARLLGFDLVENFDAPYRAVSPPDFWRRWHISLSSWLRDYLFLPLSFWFLRHVRRARLLGVKTESVAYVIGILATMTLAGLWHGASWNFVCWGLFHGLLLAGYHLAGIKGNWRPRGRRAAGAWLAMQGFVLFGWALFRAPSLNWVLTALLRPQWGNRNSWLAAAMILSVGLAYGLLLWLISRAHKSWERWPAFAQSAFHAALILVLVVFHQASGNDFIYFQF